MVLGPSTVGEEKEGLFTMKNLPQRRSGIGSTKKPESTRHAYLQVGDKVFHKKFKSWGGGIVIETRASEVPGGMCYARILFQDGKQRVFDNDFDSVCCCYYTGITVVNRVEL